MMKLDTQLFKNYAFILLALIMSFTCYSYESISTPDTAFTHANILNPNVNMPTHNATILVSNGVIVNIQPENYPIPEHYKVIDVEKKWVIPGLIDGHIHLAQSGSAFTRPDIVNATQIQSYQTDQEWLLNHTEKLLSDYVKLGITTVVDMGGPSEYLPHYTNIKPRGLYPDIYVSGTLLSPMKMPALSINGDTFTQVTNAEQAKVEVTKLLEKDVNIIKIVWSQETGLSTSELYDLYYPAINLAKQHHKLIAVHVDDLTNAKMAIKAGANILVHGVPNSAIDQEFIALMKQYNVTYMPTFTAHSRYTQLFKNALELTREEQQLLPPFILNSFDKLFDNQDKTGQMFQMITRYMHYVDANEQALSKLSPNEKAIVAQLEAQFSIKVENIQQANLRKVLAAGVNVALGTDAGNIGTFHALSLMTEILAWKKAGISNQQILRAATLGNAAALNKINTIGTISTGKSANFVILNNNPYDDISTLSQPAMTIKNGAVAYTNIEASHEK